MTIEIRVLQDLIKDLWGVGVQIGVFLLSLLWEEILAPGENEVVRPGQNKT